MVQMLGWFRPRRPAPPAGNAPAPAVVGLIGQELQRDKAVQASIFGFVNHAHAAAAQLLEDAVVRDGLVQQAAALRAEIGYTRDFGQQSSYPLALLIPENVRF